MSSRRAGRAGRGSRAPGTDPFVEPLRLRAAAADPHATSWLSAGEARRPSGVLGGRSWRDGDDSAAANAARSEEHTSELQSLMRISYAVFCLKKKKNRYLITTRDHHKI